jgi:hypothetical protein
MSYGLCATSLGSRPSVLLRLVASCSRRTGISHNFSIRFLQKCYIYILTYSTHDVLHVSFLYFSPDCLLVSLYVSEGGIYPNLLFSVLHLLFLAQKTYLKFEIINLNLTQNL